MRQGIQLKHSAEWFESFENALQVVILAINQHVQEERNARTEYNLKTLAALLLEVKVKVSKALCSNASKHTMRLSIAQTYALMNAYMQNYFDLYKDHYFKLNLNQDIMKIDQEIIN